MKLAGYEVSRLAKKSEDEGWLTRPRRGEYCLTQKGKEKLSNA
jgi:Mn-dependent DtxR family transcriptional regulator